MGSLTRKLGPLPVWAWGTLLAGGVIVVWWVRSKRTSTATPVLAGAPVSSAPADLSPVGGAGGIPSLPATGGGNSPDALANLENQIQQLQQQLSASQTATAQPAAAGAAAGPGYPVNPFNVPYSAAVPALLPGGLIPALPGNVWGQTVGTGITTGAPGSPAATGAPPPSDLIQGALPPGVSGGQIAIGGVPYYNPNGLSPADFTFQRGTHAA